MLETLLRKIQQAPDFPAFSRTVQEVSALVADHDQRSINDLCALVLRDVALTKKVLAVANTFSVREARGAVHTVSRAAMLLGFEEVRKIALTLVLFEHLQGQGHAGQLLGRMLQALFGALLAQALARPLRVGGDEQVFLAALFQHLGPLLIYRHLPEAVPEIERLRMEDGLDEKTAILRATGIVSDQLGREVASRWGLPDGLRAAMRPIPVNLQRDEIPSQQQLPWMASFANAGVSILLRVRSSRQAEAEFEEQGRLAGIESEIVQGALEEARDLMAIYARLIEGAGVASDILARLGGNLPTDLSQEESPPAPAGASGVERLLGGVEDVTASLLGDYTLPGLFSSILETLYQGLDLSLVTLLLHDPRSRVLRTSMGYGEHGGDVLKGGELSMQAAHPIVDILLGGEDRVVHRQPPPGGRKEAWSWAAADADTALILPVYVNRRPVGVFYAEGRSASLTSDALKVVKTLRNQAALAVMNKSGRA